LGFTDIHTIESLRRVLCVKKYAIPQFDFDHDVRDHQRTNVPQETKRPARGKAIKKETNLEIEDNDDDEDYIPGGDDDEEEDDNEKNGKSNKTAAPKPAIKIDFKRNNKNKRNNKSKKRKENKDEDNSESNDDDDDDENGDCPAVTKYAAKAINSQPGHTGFLTFATLLHKEYQKM
jgi:hypothetical protein